jgi:hypothetical protein
MTNVPWNRVSKSQRAEVLISSRCLEVNQSISEIRGLGAGVLCKLSFRGLNFVVRGCGM